MKISTAIRRLLHQKSLLLKVLLSYIIMGSILMSILSYVMYTKYSQNSIGEIDKISERMLNQSFNVTNSYWSSTVDYLSHLYYNSSNTLLIDEDMAKTAAPLFNALYSNVFDPIERGDITNKLIEIAGSNPLIESVYIYNRQSDTVFSNITVPMKVNEFFDKSIVDLLNKYTFSHEMEYIPREVKYSYANKNTEYNSISVVYSDGSADKPPECALIFNLRQDVLQQMVTSGTTDYTTEIFILNQDGTVISHPDSGLVNSNIKSAEYIDKILKSGSSGSFTTTIDNKKALVKFRKSDNIFKWIFVSKSDYQLLLQDTRKLQRNILIIALIFIVLSILIALAFTRNFYIPLYRILGKLPKVVLNSNGRSMNEYAVLSNTFDSLMDNVNELKYSVRSSMPFMKKEVLKQIVSGETISETDIEKKIRELKIQLFSGYYAVVVIKMEDIKTINNRLSLKDIALMRFAILNIASETLEGSFTAEGLETEQDSVILIINSEEYDTETSVRLKEALLKVQLNISEYLKLNTTITIGNYVEGISSIQASFKNAVLTYDYRLMSGKGAVLSYYDVKVFLAKPYEYPFELEKQMIETLKAQDDKEINVIVDRFVDTVATYSYDEVLVSMTQFALTAARSLKVIADIENESINMSYKTIHQQLSEYDEKIELKKWLEKFMTDILKAFREAKGNKYEGIAQNILEYIEINYQNPNISVEEIAEKIKLSPNYTRTIFKDKTGKSISNYINELRFSRATELLKNTQTPANRIAEMVGFQNPAYFYVAFKKYTGKTPEEFRREN